MHPFGHPFSQVDVFGSRPLSGNPVAVVHDADDLDTEQMQLFAQWTNLSETTFLLRPTRDEADYRLRIFTPARELPFAGHPTLGSCHAWLEAGGTPRGESVVQECEAGLLTISRGEHLAFQAPPLLREGPVDEADLHAIAGILGIAPTDVVDARWLDNGPGW
ncbi:MAG TPA: PhzF family phenazine biosynthesis protein, partial [Nocardioides sp.]|nr:PhzF family phenazine biosynthesis protein [Nocardioides sp.]